MVNVPLGRLNLARGLRGNHTDEMFFHRELERLRKKLLHEAAIVEDAIERALQSFIDRDLDLATEVISGDRAIDELEIDVEEDCLKILALYNPVAVDLRFIVSVLKMNNDLERMGDIAVSIARRASYLARRDPGLVMPPEFHQMANMVSGMIRQSLDALINGDAALAKAICRQDAEVDRMKRRIGNELRDRLTSEPAAVRSLLKMLDVARHLERLADLATNIAHDVIYLVDGEIVRHTMVEEEV